MRAVLLLFLLVILIGVALAGMIATRNYRAAHSLVEADPPAAVLKTPAATGIAGLQNVSFSSRDQLRLSAWYRAPTAGSVVIIACGTNSDRSSMLPEMRILTAAGFGVLTFDWPGLGTSQGAIRWDGQARRALTAAIDWVSMQPGVDAARIGGLGFSIGANLMTEVAGQDTRLRAVVLEAPVPAFTDYMNLHFTRWKLLSELPARWALRNAGLLETGFEPVNLVGAIAPRPVLILGGTADSEITPELVTRVYDAAGEPKVLWIVPGAHHGGYHETAPAQYARALTDFLTNSLVKKPLP
jgi:dipeptidyl aminopeptidase/acylaminoacyl peptidase